VFVSVNRLVGKIVSEITYDMAQWPLYFLAKTVAEHFGSDQTLT